MKKILSAVLALVMVAATFTMLVPNAVAAGEPQQVEAKVLYEENFDDLNGKTPAEILAGANMKDEKVGTPEYLSVKDGRLHYGQTSAEQDAYLILNDKAELASVYTLEYDLKFLAAGVGANGSRKNQVLSIFAYDTDDYVTNEGYTGMVSQMFYNGYDAQKTGNYCLSQSYYLYSTSGLHNDKFTGTGANVTNEERVTAMKSALGLEESDTLSNLSGYEMTVKVVVDRSGSSGILRTYVKTANTEYVQVSGTVSQPLNRFSNDLRLMISTGTVVQIDNMRVTGADGTTEIYAENFDDIQANTPSGILNEIGWISDKQAHNDDRFVAVEDGKLILGCRNWSDNEELILVENDVAKNGYIVEYDIMADGSYYADSGVASFHSAPGDFTQRIGRQGWISQLRYNGQALSGRHANADGWGGTDPEKDPCNTLLAKASCVSGSNIAGMKLAVKAVFDPVAGTVTTYVQDITSTDKVAWTDAHKVSTSGILNDTDVEKALWTKYIRLVIYLNLEMSIDNIKITSLEKTPNVYGYQVSTASAANIRLLGVIDNEIFTTAEKVGFKVTMTKVADPTATATKDIDCNYVYSSITQWGADTPTQAAEMLYGASHIYALHVNGISEAVTITVTPYYVDEGVTYLGDAITIEYDPLA